MPPRKSTSSAGESPQHGDNMDDAPLDANAEQHAQSGGRQSVGAETGVGVEVSYFFFFFENLYIHHKRLEGGRKPLHALITCFQMAPQDIDS